MSKTKKERSRSRSRSRSLLPLRAAATRARHTRCPARRQRRPPPLRGRSDPPALLQCTAAAVGAAGPPAGVQSLRRGAALGALLAARGEEREERANLEREETHVPCFTRNPLSFLLSTTALDYMYLDCGGKSRARGARPPAAGRCSTRHWSGGNLRTGTPRSKILSAVLRPPDVLSLARPVLCEHEGTHDAMMGEHGFLSHSLLALDRGRAQPDGTTRPAGSSTATEPCDLLAVEIEAQANPNPSRIPDPNPNPIPNRL